jgi:hypothetical protein
MDSADVAQVLRELAERTGLAAFSDATVEAGDSDTQFTIDLPNDGKFLVIVVQVDG